MHIRVRVKTGSKKEAVKILSKDRLAFSVKEKPEHNLANKRVLELVAAHYGVSPRKLRLVSGHHATSKIISLE